MHMCVSLNLNITFMVVIFWSPKIEGVLKGVGIKVQGPMYVPPAVW